MATEEDIKHINASLKGIGDQIKAQAEAAEKEVKRLGEMTGETRAKVDEMLTTQGELNARLQAAEQAVAEAGRRPEPNMQESIGKMVADQLGKDSVNSSFRGSRRVAAPRAAITSVTESAGTLVQTDRRAGILALPEQRLTIRDLVAPGTTDSNSVEYVQETGFTNAARPVAEGTAKPYSDLTFALANAPVRTIAHLFKASRQILDDASALQSFIDARARYGLLVSEEAQLLNGDGTGVNIHGLIPQASAFAAPSGSAVSLEQQIDVLRLALLQAELADFPSDGIVLSPTDWANIELLKNSLGNYLVSNPQTGAVPTLWRRPVVETKAMATGNFLAGAFKLGAQIFDRMAIEVLVSTENDKDFENNMVTIRAEERLAFAVYRPEAFVTGSLTSGS